MIFDKTNIRQRGIGNPNPIKLGRCIKELERIYGVRDGSAGQSVPKLSGGNVLYQSDIAEMIGISVDTLQNYKKLTELFPDLQDWVETGILAPTTDRERKLMNMCVCVDINMEKLEGIIFRKTKMDSLKNQLLLKLQKS